MRWVGAADTYGVLTVCLLLGASPELLLAQQRTWRCLLLAACWMRESMAACVHWQSLRCRQCLCMLAARPVLAASLQQGLSHELLHLIPAAAAGFPPALVHGTAAAG
jgi:hypothetical protein